MPLISARDLTHRYPGGVTALDGLTLELEPGIIGFVGANGAGKSTFIKILLGLLTPTRGSVTVLRHDAVAESLAVRQLVGYMLEHDCLPPQLTATDLVSHMGRLSGLPRAAARAAALAFAAAVAAGALVAGIAYVVVWEGVVASRAAGTRFLSVRHFVLALAEAGAKLPTSSFDASLTARAAAILSALAVVGAVLYAIRRLRAFEVGEAG